MVRLVFDRRPVRSHQRDVKNARWAPEMSESGQVGPCKYMKKKIDGFLYRFMWQR
jgi:hypothetical protein